MVAMDIIGCHTFKTSCVIITDDMYDKADMVLNEPVYDLERNQIFYLNYYCS